MKKAIIVIIVAIIALIIILNSRNILKLIYKTNYSEYVEKYAQENDIDPLLIYAVIKAETDDLLLTCTTDLPGVQFYTAGGMNKKEKAQDGSALVPFSGFALESEYFPNFPNRPDFKGKFLLPGEIYETETVYKLKRK